MPSDCDRHQSTGRNAVRRRRRWLRVVGGAVVAVLVIGSGIAYWALDRYVIDHVVIADVAAFEAAVASSVPVGTSPSPPPSLASAGEPTTVAALAAGVATSAVTSATASDRPVVTPTSYRSDAMSIEITETVVGAGDDRLVYFVADVVLADATTLRGGFAQNKFGTNIIEDTSDIASRYGAVFAINGDYYGFRESGIVIRNGVLFRDDPARDGLAMYADGRVEIYDETSTSGDELLAAGVWNTLSFGPPLVDDGIAVSGIDEVEIDANFGNHSVQGRHPRTAIGIVAPNHYLFVAVDGRSRGYSRGVTLPELADLLVALGSAEAYNLDGGGSTTMFFDGAVVNDPLGRGRERGTSDVLYLAEPTAAASPP